MDFVWNGMNIGAFIGDATPWLIAILFIVGLGGSLVTLWWLGFLTSRPYTCYIIADRAGSFAPRQARGRKVKTGKFELFFGPMNAKTIQEVDEKYIYPGEYIFFRRRVHDDYTPILLEDAEDSILTMNPDPAMAPAAKLTYSQTVKEVALRLSKPDWLRENSHLIAFLVAAIIIAIGVIVGGSMMGSGSSACANSVTLLTNKLGNASIGIAYPSAPVTSTATLPYNPQKPLG